MNPFLSAQCCVAVQACVLYIGCVFGCVVSSKDGGAELRSLFLPL